MNAVVRFFELKDAFDQGQGLPQNTAGLLALAAPPYLNSEAGQWALANRPDLYERLAKLHGQAVRSFIAGY